MNMENSELFEANDEQKVCKKISRDLCGEIIKQTKNKAEVRFVPTESMIMDDNMLIHHGFVFCAASFCADFTALSNSTRAFSTLFAAI